MTRRGSVANQAREADRLDIPNIHHWPELTVGVFQHAFHSLANFIWTYRPSSSYPL